MAIDVVVAAMRFIIGIIQNVIKWFGDMVTAVVNTAKSVGDFFTQLPKTIMQTLSGAGTWLVQIGKDIMNGLLNGLKSMWANVTNFIGDVANNVANTFKNILGIRSPSVIFYGFGENIVEGLVNGVMNLSGTYEEVMARLAATGAKNFVKTATGNMAVDMDALVNTYSAAWNSGATKAERAAGDALRNAIGSSSLQGLIDKLTGQTSFTRGNKSVVLSGTDMSRARVQELLAQGYKVEKQPKGTIESLINQISGNKPMAKGGFVRSPLNALIGEAGPEVVVPLNKFEKWMGLDDKAGKVINYYAAENKSIDSEQALIQAIKRAKVITAW